MRDTTESDDLIGPNGPTFGSVTPPTFIGPNGSPSPTPGFVDGNGNFVPGFGPPLRLALLPPLSKTPPPISGGTLAVARDGSVVVAADSDRDAVHIRRSNGVVTSVSLPAGSEPGRVVLDGSGRAHVALRSAAAVALIDIASASVLATTAACAQPRGLAFDAASNTVSVACATGKLVTLQAADHAVVGELLLDTDARDVLSDGAGGFKISRFRSAELVSLAADGRTLGRAKGHAASRPNFNALLMFDDAGTPASPTQNLDPAVAWRTAAGANGSTWMLHQQSLSDVVSETTQGGYGSDTCSTVTQAAVTEFDANGAPGRVLGVDLHGLSVDLAVSPDGAWIAVASPGGYLQRLATLQVANTSSASSGTDVGCGSFTQIADGFDAQTTSVAFDAQGLLYTFSRDPASISVYKLDASLSALQLLSRNSVASDSVRDTGHDIFHADVGTGMACASCHGEATDDGHVWDFSSSGPRRTQNIRGGILNSAPYHWSGDLGSVQMLLDEVMTKRMGGFTVEPAYTERLGQWLDVQPQQAPDVTAVSAAAARGKVLFESERVACSSCHSGPTLTNHEGADVGTGGTFQVPSLRGIALRPPYMHDGCAATLDARFDPACGGGDKHGFTSQLGSSDRADLVAYLATL